MALISSRFMTADQLQRCCYNQISAEVIGYVLHTVDGQRIGTVEEFLVNDEDFVVRYLVVDTSTAEFLLNQPLVLVPADLCCWDGEKRTVRSRATAEQVQSAPAYDPAVAVTQAYEETFVTKFGERPSGPTQF